VKHIANLAGKKAISGASTTHMRMKKAATQNAMMPPMKLFSPGRKLKIDSQPCGSGSDLPNTKFFACYKTPLFCYSVFCYRSMSIEL